MFDNGHESNIKVTHFTIAQVLKFYISDKSKDIKSQKTLTIETVLLQDVVDEILSTVEQPLIVMKMDIEGFECRAIQGNIYALYCNINSEASRKTCYNCCKIL